MSDLESLIREIISQGNLSHLSLAPRKVEQADGKFKDGWGAAVSPAAATGNAFAHDPDPINALKTAIKEAMAYGKPRPNPAVRKQPKPAATADDLDDLGL
jgi:hypothetical protein